MQTSRLLCRIVLELILPNNPVSRRWEGAFPQQTIASWKLSCLGEKQTEKAPWPQRSSASGPLQLGLCRGGGVGRAQEGNCERIFFKACGLGRAPGTWFSEIGVLLISNSQGWMCCGAGRLLVVKQLLKGRGELAEPGEGSHPPHFPAHLTWSGLDHPSFKRGSVFFCPKATAHCSPMPFYVSEMKGQTGKTFFWKPVTSTIYICVYINQVLVMYESHRGSFPFRIFFTHKKAVFSKKLAPDCVWLKYCYIIVACAKNDSWKQTKWAERLGRPHWQPPPPFSPPLYLQVRHF